MHVSLSAKQTALPALVLTASLLVPQDPATGSSAAAPAVEDVPPVLTGETWLNHHGEDLLPFWDMPDAYGDPMGNFPSFRDRAGELVLEPPA